MSEFRYVLLGRFVLALAEGWRFAPRAGAAFVVQPMEGHAGNYRVLMTRGEE